MAAVPALHVITDDAVLAGSGFRGTARSILDRHGPAVALHLRGPRTATRVLHEVAASVVDAAHGAGALLLVNDRVDIALAVDADGVQLGGRSIPPVAARRLGPTWRIGVSVHAVDEIEARAGGTADFVLLGTVWESASHPGRPGGGPALIAAAVAAGGPPVIAIGGVTPERAGEAVAEGAVGVAAMRGIWHAPDPAAAAGDYLAVMKRESGSGR